jgi:hypothetical protein
MRGGAVDASGAKLKPIPGSEFDAGKVRDTLTSSSAPKGPSASKTESDISDAWRTAKKMSKEGSLPDHNPGGRSELDKTAAAEAPPAALRIIDGIKLAAAQVLRPVLDYREVLQKHGGPDDTVENVLDLNFLNPQNLAYFVGMLPKLRSIQDALGRLLVATRLGLPHVEEETVRSTLRQLDGIVNGLSSLAYTDSDE